MRKTLKALLIPVLASTAAAAITGVAKADGSMTYYYQAPTTNYYYDPPATTYYYSPPTTHYYYIERPMRCHLGVCY